MGNIEEWKTRLCRPASRMLLGGFRPPEDLLVSWFGRVTLEEPNEAWPQSEGRLMWPLAQIVESELPSVPEKLNDIALIRVFIDPEFHECDTDIGKGWCLRASKSLNGLVEAEIPSHGSVVKPLPVRWEQALHDYPSHEDLPSNFPEELVDDWIDEYETLDGSKVGGWPYLVQSEIYWYPWNEHPASPVYVFQLDSSEKANWSWGDQGVGYFGRGTGEHRDTWAMTWQCM